MMSCNDAAYALQKPVDQAISRLQVGVSLSSKKKAGLESFIKQELGFIRTMSGIQEGLKAYKKCTAQMDDEARLAEEHCSQTLGIHMRAQGMPKPSPRWEAHAIVSGAHGEADVLRAIMALATIRVDDPDNGAWLPKTAADRVGTIFPDAVVHGRIHRWHYYRWLEQIVTFDKTEPEIRLAMREIRVQLQTSTFPESVMKKKGEK